MPSLFLAAAALLLLAGAPLALSAFRWARPRPPSAPAAAFAPPRPDRPPLPPAWYRSAWAQTGEALAAGRPAEAIRLGHHLVDASTRAFGPDHPYTWWAWQRLTAAHLVDGLIDPGHRDRTPRRP
ncbi:hypothetical protein ACIQF6_28765 [Kitasatospora sp. NPDC092948]|uniref:hypothetical protein n=1 Tax=Kitasatospora sp. NPDC092948 TaxID=3364088 RepID=UPI003818D697